jgi:hypothetical protein
VVQAFTTNFSLDEIQVRVEKERSKGGGLFKKKLPEEISYSHLLLLPCIYFEFEYLGSVEINRYIGLYQKGPRKSGTVYCVFWGRYYLKYDLETAASLPQIFLAAKDFRPELGQDVISLRLDEITEGFYLSFDQLSAEELANKIVRIIKSGEVLGGLKLGDFESLNIGSDVRREDLLKVTKVLVVYMPYWLAKYQTPEATRYVVYNRDGKKDNEKTDLLNSNHAYAVELEQRKQKIGSQDLFRAQSTSDDVKSIDQVGKKEQ